MAIVLDACGRMRWMFGFAASALIHGFAVAALVSVANSEYRDRSLHWVEGHCCVEAICVEASFATFEDPPETRIKFNAETAVTGSSETPVNDRIDLKPRECEVKRNESVARGQTSSDAFDLSDSMASLKSGTQRLPAAPERLDEGLEIKEPERLDLPKMPTRISAPQDRLIVVPSFQISGIDEAAVRVPLSTNEPPRYPLYELQNRIVGRVVLRITVERNGAVTSVQVATSSGAEGLDRAAMVAVAKWRFEPLESSMVAEPEILFAPIAFKLD